MRFLGSNSHTEGEIGSHAPTAQREDGLSEAGRAALERVAFGPLQSFNPACPQQSTVADANRWPTSLPITRLHVFRSPPTAARRRVRPFGPFTAALKTAP